MRSTRPLLAVARPRAVRRGGRRPLQRRQIELGRTVDGPARARELGAGASVWFRVRPKKEGSGATRPGRLTPARPARPRSPKVERSQKEGGPCQERAYPFLLTTTQPTRTTERGTSSCLVARLQSIAPPGRRQSSARPGPSTSRAHARPLSALEQAGLLSTLTSTCPPRSLRMKNDTSTPAALRPVESNATSADLKKTDAAEIRHLERGAARRRPWPLLDDDLN